jgi:hypothetical protein
MLGRFVGWVGALTTASVAACFWLGVAAAATHLIASGRPGTPARVGVWFAACALTGGSCWLLQPVCILATLTCTMKTVHTAGAAARTARRTVGRSWRRYMLMWSSTAGSRTVPTVPACLRVRCSSACLPCRSLGAGRISTAPEPLTAVGAASITSTDGTPRCRDHGGRAHPRTGAGDASPVRGNPLFSPTTMDGGP